MKENVEDMSLDFPKPDDYLKFLEIFSSHLKNGFKDICFYTYGSINNPREFYSGSSDIDAGLILDSGVISSKHRKKIKQLNEVLAEALIKTRIRIDLNLLDRQTNCDGRFLSYSQSMTDHIKTDGRIISGPAYFLDELNGLNYRHEDLSHGAFNLRDLRNRFLFSYYDSYNNYRDFAEGVLSNIKKAVKFPKQLVLIQTGKLIINKAEARKKLQEILEGVDLERIIELNSILRNTGVLLKELKNRDNAIRLLEDSLDAVELIIRDYLLKYPLVSDKEVKINYDGFRE